MAAQLLEIPVNKIRENKAALRPVNRKTEGYEELVESIRIRGVLNPIVVRPMTDSETGEQYYGLVDGLHRWSASKDAGKSTIPANVITMDEAESLEAQIIGNIQRIETKPVEYSKGLQRLLSQNPLLTERELASKLGKSTSWIRERLGLLNLNEGIAKLVDEGRINLSNAFALAKLPPEVQTDFAERAMTQSPQEFAPLVKNRKNEIEKARREGRDPSKETWQPVAHLRSMSTLKEELEKREVGPALLRLTGVSTPEDAFTLGIQWALNIDPQSVEIQKQREEERKKVAAEKREAAKAQRDKLKQERSAIISERLKIETAHADAKTDPTADLEVFDKANGLVGGKFVTETKSEE